VEIKGCVHLKVRGEFSEVHEDIAHPRNPLGHVLVSGNASLDLSETKRISAHMINLSMKISSSGI
jgi:hypothetical protein